MRILLSVGCDDYQFAPKLSGAVKDAKSVFSALVGDQEHQYSAELSKLLVSPTAEQLRIALSEILYNNTNIIVFTLYFAGHAAVFDETLYIAPVDTLTDRIPATAIGFPDVLRTTVGARPKQANFIVDACNSAGLGFDIGSILKRTIVGNSDTMGISFIASAAAEETAKETIEGGRFTLEFTRILHGDVFVQQARPFLSLAEIAQQVQALGTIENQTISYWTLNLQGPNLFAKNPYFSGSAQTTDRIVAQLQRQTVGSGIHAAEFKSAVIKMANGVDERALSKTLESVFSKIEPDQRTPLIYGLAEGLAIELPEANDRFLETRVYNVLFGQLLGLCPPSARMSAMNELIEWYISANRRTLAQLNDTMTTDRNALLLDTLSDLYELPIRLSDIFGQCALFFFAQRNFSESDSRLVSEVVRKILARYGNSILALTDDQATGFLLFLEMCRRKGWLEFSEEVIGRLYHDMHENYARCGAYSLSVEQRLSLLTERYQHSLSITKDVYNFPSDLSTVILSFCAIAKLDDAVDRSLLNIDHTSINYFIPDGFERFGLNEGLVGANYTITLGRDFWRCIDLRRILQTDILPKLNASSSNLSWQDSFCSAASALALRDRLPWHIVGKHAAATSL